LKHQSIWWVMFDAKIGDLVCVRGSTRELTHNLVFIHNRRHLTYNHDDTAGYASNSAVFIVLDVDDDYRHTMCVYDGKLMGWTDVYDWKKL
jgi:hypothetical protein